MTISIDIYKTENAARAQARVYEGDGRATKVYGPQKTVVAANHTVAPTTYLDPQGSERYWVVVAT